MIYYDPGQRSPRYNRLFYAAKRGDAGAEAEVRRILKRRGFLFDWSRWDALAKSMSSVPYTHLSSGLPYQPTRYEQLSLVTADSRARRLTFYLVVTDPRGRRSTAETVYQKAPEAVFWKVVRHNYNVRPGAPAWMRRLPPPHHILSDEELVAIYGEHLPLEPRLR